MKNTIFYRESLLPEKEYIMDYVHQLYDAAGDLVFPLRGVKPLVAPGDPVSAGQKICQSDDGAVCVHSPCSGSVKVIERRATGRGECECIVLENDRKFAAEKGEDAPENWLELSRSEILRRILEAGAAGTCAKKYPTSAKLASLDPESVSRIVVDGSEWESIVTSDDDILRTHSYGVVTGLRILLRLFPGAEGMILIGEDKTSAIDYILGAADGAEGIHVMAVPEGRPLGDERMIDRLFSEPGRSAGRVHCLVETPAEINAIYEAVCLARPYIRRIVTVAGSAVKNPGNYLVRVGTSCAELLQAAGGLRKGAAARKAVLGGPITGVALSSLDIPIEKDTTALLLFSEDEEAVSGETETECIRCGRCARACPVGLMPMLMLRAAEKCDLEQFGEKLHGRECIGCGVCTWICPAKRPLSQMFAYAASLVGAGQK